MTIIEKIANPGAHSTIAAIKYHCGERVLARLAEVARTHFHRFEPEIPVIISDSEDSAGGDVEGGNNADGEAEGGDNNADGAATYTVGPGGILSFSPRAHHILALRGYDMSAWCSACPSPGDIETLAGENINELITTSAAGITTTTVDTTTTEEQASESESEEQADPFRVVWLRCHGLDRGAYLLGLFV